MFTDTPDLAPLAPDQLATVKRYAVAIVDDERVASYVLRMHAEHEAQRARIAEFESARFVAALSDRVAELERERNEAREDALAAIDAQGFNRLSTWRTVRIRSYAAEAAKDKP